MDELNKMNRENEEIDEEKDGISPIKDSDKEA